jgi:phosphatidate cytidylyltransferase
MAELLMSPFALALGAVWGALLAGSGAVAALAHRRGPGTCAELVARTRTWWWILGLVSAALLLGSGATILLVAAVSFLAFREFHAIVPIRMADRALLALAYLAIPIQYGFIWMGWYGMFAIFVPVYAFIVLAAAAAVLGETRGFLRASGQLHWALMLTVYCIGHLAFLAVLPLARPVAAGGAGLLLFVLLIVQGNDVLQYLWGRTLGARPIVPRVSPGKTWAGFLGGMACSALLAGLIGPWLTPMAWLPAAGLGALLALAGFAGDILMSAIKRDLGLKDTGTALPGHGGVLDRLDSLTLAAPLAFHVIRYFYGA